MSNDNHVAAKGAKTLLEQIEQALLNASPKQIDAYLRKAGLTGKAEENIKRLRCALALDYSSDIAGREELKQATLMEIDGDDQIASRMRIRFALAAQPELDKILGVTLASLNDLPDDMVGDVLQRLQALKKSPT